MMKPGTPSWIFTPPLEASEVGKWSRDWPEQEGRATKLFCAGHGRELPMMVKPQGRLCFTTGIRLTSCFRGLAFADDPLTSR